MTWNEEHPGSEDASAQSAAEQGAANGQTRGEIGRPVEELGRELDVLNERLRRSQERMRALLQQRRTDGPDGVASPAIRTDRPLAAAPARPTPPLQDDPFGGGALIGPSSAGLSQDPFADVRLSSGTAMRPADDPFLVIDLREVPADPSPVDESDVWGGSRRRSALRVGTTSMTWATPGPTVFDPIWGPPTSVEPDVGWTPSVTVASPPDQGWLAPSRYDIPTHHDTTPPQETAWDLEGPEFSGRPSERSDRDTPDSRPAEVVPGTTRPGWQSNLITLMVALVVLVVALVFVGAI